MATRAGADPDAVLPLCALGLLLLPYLPWLPDRVPAVRLAAGPARYLLWLVVAWLVGGRLIAGAWPRASASSAPLAVFLASTLAFGAVAWKFTDTTLFPGGDEPHYLVITQSLLHDADLKIENNH